MSDCGHNEYWVGNYGTCMVCRAEKAEQERDSARAEAVNWMNQCFQARTISEQWEKKSDEWRQENATLRKQVEGLLASNEKDLRQVGQAAIDRICDDAYALQKAEQERDSARKDLEAARAEAARLGEAVEILRWLLNLHCGVSKGGGEVSDSEYEDALEQGKKVLEALSSSLDTAEWMAGKMAEAENQGEARMHKRLTAPSPCGINGHFAIQNNGSTCLVCRDEKQRMAEERAKVWDEAARIMVPSNGVGAPEFLPESIRQIFEAKARGEGA